MKKLLTPIILTGGLVISGMTMAAKTAEKVNNDNALTGSLALGFLAGESKEFIYHPTNGGEKSQ